MKRHLLGILAIASLVILSCSQEEEKINSTTKEAAIRYAHETKKVLGKGLKHAIKQKGLVYAITFCSDTAEVLAQNAVKDLDVEIKRVSDRNRNPNNAANEEELSYINKAKKELLEGKEIQAAFHRSQGKVVAYIPILTKPFCLTCHGEPNVAISPEVHQKIGELYPDDKAINYKDNELRGIWVVEMMEKSEDSNSQ